MIARAVPVLPDPDRARELLRRELLDPAYRTDDPIRALLDRIERLLSAGTGRAAAVDGIGLVVVLVVVLALVLAIGWLATRPRRTTRRGAPAGVLEETGVDARTLRRRAETALAEGRHSEAVVEGFRALALRQHEAGALRDAAALPSSTVTEVARALAAAHPDRADAVRAAAARFDAVRYGGRLASAEQARAVLALDDELAGVSR